MFWKKQQSGSRVGMCMHGNARPREELGGLLDRPAVGRVGLLLQAHVAFGDVGLEFARIPAGAGVDETLFPVRTASAVVLVPPFPGRGRVTV